MGPAADGAGGGSVGDETRTRGIRQVLSPVVNIASDVRWGRVEETYGEDPYLSSVMGVAFVQAFERAGVVTTPKHFVANVGDGGRDSYPIDVSERALVERFFPPFEAAVRQARARSVMTAYNSVDGTPATQNRHLLTDVLKGQWGFGGFVISDAAATGGATVLHMTEPDTPAAAAHAWRAGLDVVFQTSHPQHAPYLDAVRRGLVPIDVIDAAVARVLRRSSSSACSSSRTWIRRKRRRSTAAPTTGRWRARPRARRSSCSRTSAACCRSRRRSDRSP